MLALLARGRTNAEIAAEFFIGLSTVKSHVASLMAARCPQPSRDRHVGLPFQASLTSSLGRQLPLVQVLWASARMTSSTASPVTARPFQTKSADAAGTGPAYAFVVERQVGVLSPRRRPVAPVRPAAGTRRWSS